MNPLQIPKRHFLSLSYQKRKEECQDVSMAPNAGIADSRGRNLLDGEIINMTNCMKS